MEMLAEAKFLFALDTEGLLKIKAAQNVETPISLLILLAKDVDETVREEVARNAATPAAALVTLTTDEDEAVRAAAMGTLSIIGVAAQERFLIPA